MVDEGDNFTVSVVGGLPVGASLEETGEGLYLFTWTLQAVINDSLIFQAVDSAGASSQLNPQLQICGCVNEGQCTLDGVLDTKLPVIVFKCTCPEGLFVCLFVCSMATPHVYCSPLSLRWRLL